MYQGGPAMTIFQLDLSRPSLTVAVNLTGFRLKALAFGCALPVFKHWRGSFLNLGLGRGVLR
jgi:hypothetical protein